MLGADKCIDVSMGETSVQMQVEQVKLACKNVILNTRLRRYELEL